MARSKKENRKSSAGDGDRGASYARYSSDLQREESIADQQRKCRECAERNGHQIAPELEFADEAVSGTKLQRKGLGALLKAAADGEFDVLYFHSLSRLARESVISMPMLKQLVHVHRVRVISVTEGIDSDREGWDMMATLLSMQHERYIKDLGENVFRGQEGNVLNAYSVGDYCFGYSSVPAPGYENQRRTKNARTPQVYVVDPETSEWVLRIFHWFVHERRGQSWIARELNRLQVRKDHRSTTKAWTHALVTALLQRRKYTGWWPWGEKQNVRNPLTGQVSQEQRPSEETEKWLRHFPQLRLVDDETFEAAQRLLQENSDKFAGSRNANGKLNGSEAGASAPRRLLSGLIQCGACGSNWHVGGAHGRYLFCPGRRRGICSCAMQLRWDLAERLILQEIGAQILKDPAWHQAVFEQSRAAWQTRQSVTPSELKAAEAAFAQIDRKIANLLDMIEDGSAEPAVKSRLAERRSERQALARKIESLRRVSVEVLPEPTEAWVAEQLGKLGDVLSSDDPAAAYALRDLIDGKIVIKQGQRPGRRGNCLQGHFAINSGALLPTLLGNGSEQASQTPLDDGDRRQEFVVDFVEPDPNDALAETAKRYYDQGLLNTAIAQEMGIWPSQVTKLLQHWCQLHGQSLPDARTRRASLPRKTMEVRRYEQIADQAVELMHRGYSDAKIGRLLGCSDFVAAKAIRHWHQLRKLPTPTRKQRREALARRAQQLLATQAPMKAIAKELGCSMPTLRRLLEIAHRLDGQTRPDGRSRKSWPPKDESDPEGDCRPGAA